jgi:hypothetical protein
MSDEGHFNELTPAELERLALAAEEMGEAIQIIGKIMRHGYQCYNPDDAHQVPNRLLLEKEIGHVTFAIMLMENAGDLNRVSVGNHLLRKKLTITKWLHHNKV